MWLYHSYLNYEKKSVPNRYHSLRISINVSGGDFSKVISKSDSLESNWISLIFLLGFAGLAAFWPRLENSM